MSEKYTVVICYTDDHGVSRCVYCEKRPPSHSRLCPFFKVLHFAGVAVGFVIENVANKIRRRF